MEHDLGKAARSAASPKRFIHTFGPVMKRRRITILAVSAILAVLLVCLVFSFNMAKRGLHDPRLPPYLENWNPPDYDVVWFGIDPQTEFPCWTFWYHRPEGNVWLNVSFLGRTLCTGINPRYGTEQKAGEATSDSARSAESEASQP